MMSGNLKPNPLAAAEVDEVKSLLRTIESGATMPYDDVQKTIGFDTRSGSGAGYRRSETARRQLEDEGINVVRVDGVGFHRQTDEEIGLSQAAKRKARARRLRRDLIQASNAKQENMRPEVQVEHMTEKLIATIMYKVATKQSKQRLLTAVKEDNAVLPMAKALDRLKDEPK